MKNRSAYPALAAVTLMAGLSTAAAAEDTIRQCSDQPIALPDGAESLKSRVVLVKTMASSGSGVMVSPDGYVLTAAHVVGEAKTVKVTLADGSSVEGSVVRSDHEADLALVSTSLKNASCVPLEPEPASAGATVFVVGSPLGDELLNTVTSGVVSGNRDVGSVPVVQTDAAVSPGSSGGGMFSSSGKLLAVVSYKSTAAGAEGLGFGVSVAAVEPRLGLAFGDESSGPLEPRVTAKSAKSGFPEPRIDGAPASLPPLAKAKCKDLDVIDDPFGDSYISVVSSPDHVLLFDSNAQNLVLGLSIMDAMRFGSDMSVLVPPAALSIDIKLENAAVVTLASLKGAQAIGPRGGGVQVLFPLNAAVSELLASSPVTHIRWSMGGESKLTWSIDDKKARKEWTRSFTCMVKDLQ